ncbi:MAG: hypothetical protein AB1649_04610 [Chloroflexota bacterium]
MPEQKSVMLPKIILAALIPLVLLGCSPAIPTTQELEAPTPLNTESVFPSPSQGNEMQVTQPPTPSDPGLQGLLEQAKMDLAQRLFISITEITLVEITSVEWSDSSLDCPQPGMSYLQVITPGYRILLEANGSAYEYHSNGTAHVVYCENSSPPFTPKP